MSQPMKPHWFQILLALADRDLHGTAIMEEVLERTDGHMKLWPGTLYGSLHELTEAGFIRETEPPEAVTPEGGRPRFYALAPAGRLALRGEVGRLAGLIRAARAKRVVDDLGPI
jgi:DNA-binding PadR family transcriptional regulator